MGRKIAVEVEPFIPLEYPHSQVKTKSRLVVGVMLLSREVEMHISLMPYGTDID